MDASSVAIGDDPPALRAACRSGALGGITAGLAMGRVQANLVILPQALAFEFLLFCQRNPKPCPIVDVTDIGDPEPARIAPGADLRTDLPRYRIWRDGVLDGEATDISDLWRDDFVGFLIGCSFTFENALRAAGLPLRHIERGSNVPMYVTDIACAPAGRFAGPMVVSMRPVPRRRTVTAVEITGDYPRAHGAPVHVGDPAAIGIGDLDRPDFGDAVPVDADEVPMFWACGVTPQAVIMNSRPDIAITHAPGHMFIADLADQELRG
ncbi:MAG: putative hydro-lyase [Alphaproteobacteria bacterium]|jgi:uncharacterized protein YcsI (UPF0317 family)|nr:putative hydro-lyase [Alphaproteobacteria bacterium]MDP6517331.1 putative hydro-lyase [Alphaproteobacteria bacterium]